MCLVIMRSFKISGVCCGRERFDVECVDTFTTSLSRRSARRRKVIHFTIQIHILNKATHPPHLLFDS